MANEMKIFDNGLVTTNGKEFTRLMGGFGENKPMLTDKQVAELLEYAKGARAVRELLSRKDVNGKENISYFEFGTDIIDFKRVSQQDTLMEQLILMGYAKQSITQAENIYGFSKAGFILFLKFAEGEKSIELYKNFIEDYFKTKAENVVMKRTMHEELEFLKEQKGNILGKMFMCHDDNKKMEYFTESEKYTERIKDIEIAMSKENLIEQLQPKLNIADRLTNSDSCFDMNAFAKAVRIKGLGRNNMFEWLREQGILRPNNEPYDRYMDYFKVIYNPNPYNNKINVKTLVRPKGISYIFKKLIKDGKMIMISIDEVLSELEPEAIN